ncbi:MAG: DNA replication/repair protein RecF [Clostridia bacterium]
MIIKSLQLKNFRNYTAESVEFDKGINVLTGKNASGKTNMLEAIYLLGVGKSPRTSKERELINFNAEKASIKAIIEKKYRSHTIEVLFEGNGKKIKIDGLPIAKLSELIGILNVVYFSPDELKFIKETPAERRRFLDISLCQQSKTYFISLARYNKILAQRNKLLKVESRNPALPEMLSVWDAQMAEYGANLILARRAYVKKLQGFASTTHAELTDNTEVINLSYETSIESERREDIVSELLKKLSDNVEKDINLSFTTIGAHRDDIKITVNGLDARKFASQGQQRTTALSIKIAELSLFKQETGESPILLLDDVLSELDENRKQKLLSLSSYAQTVITCTEFDFKPTNMTKLYLIRDGKIIK